MEVFATPGHKSRADAARWAARRTQEGGSQAAILRELRQDGVSEADAEEAYRRVRKGLDALSTPRGWALVRLAVAVVAVVALNALVWSKVKPGPPDAMGYAGQIIGAFGVALGLGAVCGILTGGLSYVGRSWKVTLIALAADAAGMILPSKISGADGPGVLLTAIGIAAAAAVTIWVLTRPAPRKYNLSVGDDGSFHWQRDVEPVRPWDWILNGATPWR